MIIGIEAIVACIMSIDKDDPPRRVVEGVEPELLTPPLLLCKKVADVLYCVYREKEGFNLLVLFSSKKLRFVY